MPSQSDPTQRTPRVRRLVAAQAAAGAAVALIAGVVAGRAAAQAALLGALTGLVPQAWFAWRVLRRDVLEGGAATMLRAMYLGEAFKLAFIAVMFVGIFRLWPAVPPLPLLLALIAVLAVHWLAPVLLQQR